MKFNEYVSMLTESLDSEIQQVIKELGFEKVNSKNIIQYHLPETGIYLNFVSDDDIDGGIAVYETPSQKSKQLYAFDIRNFLRKKRIIKQLIDHIKSGKLTRTEEDFYDEKLNK